MATKLSSFDFTKASDLTSSEKATYPWGEWLDGDIWKLIEGEDFQTHPLMMERIIRTRATSKRARVRLRHAPLDDDSNGPFGVIVVQRVDIEGPTAVAEAEAAAAAKKAEAAAKRAERKLAQHKGTNGDAVAPIETPVKAKRTPKPKTATEVPAKVAVSKIPSKRLIPVGASA